MKILFIHQNFPGQFKFLAPALVSRGHEVVALSMQPPPSGNLHGVKIIPYSNTRGTTPNIHPWVSDFETKVIRAEACFKAALELRSAGFTPDAIVAHHGWGESLFVKDVWGSAKLGVYSEFYYQADGADVGFDPEFPISDPGELCRVHLKNINNLLHFEFADAGISPTRWQADTFPADFRKKITVVHDGIDTSVMCPKSDARFQFKDGTAIVAQDEVITFVNRNLEPYRGYHIFMRALANILRRRPHARVLIVGGDGVSYGAAPASGSWKEIFASEARRQITDSEWSRVHFLGSIPYENFITLLQISTVHVYLSYPFVLSWSLLEAMSAGCAIVASDTAPVREAVRQGQTGQLVDFFDSKQLSDEVVRLLANPAERARLGENARKFAQAEYDLRQVCLPKQIRWVEQLVT